MRVKCSRSRAMRPGSALAARASGRANGRVSRELSCCVTSCSVRAARGLAASPRMAYTLRVEAVQAVGSVPILEAMGIRVVDLRPGFAAADLPPEPNVNHFGVTYAGSLFSVAEMLGGLLSLATFDLEEGGELAGCVPLVKESTIRFRRPALGVVRATASLSDDEVARVRADALATGKGEFVLEATLTDAAGEVVASTVGTYQLRRLG
ncbi:MAG TPA: YiiD C-terminal domain-containing protein [Nocardioides sp.]|nr:YiiD C-terminal domain-containing protein [Nocardioides sp.]